MSCNSNNSTALPTVATNGTQGANGRGISSIIRTSGTGAAGTTDTYTITYTDATTSTFTILNGSVGTTGSTGITLLSNNIIVDTPSSGAYVTLKSYLLPANTLTTIGDILEVKAIIETSDTAAVKNAKVIIGGTDAMPKLSLLNYLYIAPNNPYIELNFTITRKSATTVFISYNVPFAFGTPFYSSPGSYLFYEASITVNNLTLTTNLIDIQGFTTAPDIIVCKQLTIKSIKI